MLCVQVALAQSAFLLQVTVRAIGLNFRDVLNILGMYPGDPGPPGGDCSGIVAEVGPGNTQLKMNKLLF